MPLALAYILIILLGILLIAARKESSLLSGRTFYKFHLFFIGLVTLVDIMLRNSAWIIDAVILLVGTCAMLWIKNKILIFRSSFEEVSKSLEDDFQRVLIPFEKRNDIYTLPLQGGEVTVQVSRFWFGGHLISFGQSSKQKKVQVLRALIHKKYHGVFPRLTIHLKQHVKNN